jgi:hypothetical protein
VFGVFLHDFFGIICFLACFEGDPSTAGSEAPAHLQPTSLFGTLGTFEHKPHRVSPAIRCDLTYEESCVGDRNAKSCHERVTHQQRSWCTTPQVLLATGGAAAACVWVRHAFSVGL